MKRFRFLWSAVLILSLTAAWFAAPAEASAQQENPPSPEMPHMQEFPRPAAPPDVSAWITAPLSEEQVNVIPVPLPEKPQAAAASIVAKWMKFPPHGKARFYDAAKTAHDYSTIPDALADFTPQGGSGPLLIGSGKFSSPVSVDLTVSVPQMTGWAGSPSNPPVISAEVVISNGVNFTLQHIKFIAGVQIDTYTGLFALKNIEASHGPAFGVSINQPMNLEVVNSYFHSNTEDGLHVENSSNGYLSIRNSVFAGNGAQGIFLMSGGNTELSGIQATDNESGGLLIYNINPLGLTSIQGNSLFERNMGSGLMVASQGDVNVDRVAALRNTGMNGFIHILTPGKYMRISNSEFSYLYGGIGIGLLAVANGEVTLNRVSVRHNAESMGFNMENDDMTAPVSLTQCDMSNNGMSGIYMNGGGNVLLKNSSSSGNQDSGANGIFIDNSGGSGSITIQGASISKPARFDHNGNNGMLLVTSGPVVVRNMTANGNAVGGAQVISLADSEPPVTISSSKFNRNGAPGGLDIIATGSVTLQGVATQQTYGGFGTQINSNNPNQNPVSIQASNFSGNSDTNLFVLFSGPLTIKKVVSDNSQRGLGMNILPGWPGVPVNIQNSLFRGNQSGNLVILNQGGNVQVKNTTANGARMGDGAIINIFGVPDTSGTLEILSSTFTGNYLHGIVARTSGQITLRASKVVGNGVGAGEDSGAILDSSQKNAPIHLYTTRFTGNGNYGLEATMGTEYLHLYGSKFTGNNVNGLLPGAGEYLAEPPDHVIIH